VDIAKLIAAVHAEHGVSLDKDDPALQLATILRVVQDEARAEYRAEAEELRKALAEAIAGARLLSPEGEKELAKRVSGAVALGADERAARLAGAHNRRTVLVLAATLLGVAVIAAGSGWWAGRDAGRAEAAATAADLRVEFADGAEGAAIWRDLIKFNRETITRAAAQCERIADASGRPACSFALWTGPGPQAPAKAKR